MQWLKDHLYLTRARAIALGFTHEGRLFGVPAWLCDVEQEHVFGCPKVPLLQFWGIFADVAFEAMTHFMSQDMELVAVRVGEPIHVVVA